MNLSKQGYVKSVTLRGFQQAGMSFSSNSHQDREGTLRFLQQDQAGSKVLRDVTYCKHQHSYIGKTPENSDLKGGVVLECLPHIQYCLMVLRLVSSDFLRVNDAVAAS